jgi:putative membrane protein
MRRFLRWIIVTSIVQTFVLLFLAWVLPGFSLGEPQRAIFSALVISLVVAIAWPLIYRVAGEFHPILFPILTFVLTGLIIYFVGVVDVEGFRVDSVWTGIVVSLGMTAGSVLFGAVFSLDDSSGYEWFVVRPLSQSFASTPKSSTPGVLFLEIDGLAEPILKQAIDGGYMPTLKRWIDEGSHKLVGWEPDLSSQTSASQAGILLGDNTGIPAFRWYDKPSGKLMVSSKMETAQELEHRLSSGDGLLTDGGASRWNVFSGDSHDCLCTFSAIGDKTRSTSRSYAAYFSNPFTFSRTLSLLVSDVVRERYQAWRQIRRDEQPRIHRHF